MNNVKLDAKKPHLNQLDVRKTASPGPRKRSRIYWFRRIGVLRHRSHQAQGNGGRHSHNRRAGATSEAIRGL